MATTIYSSHLYYNKLSQLNLKFLNQSSLHYSSHLNVQSLTLLRHFFHQVQSHLLCFSFYFLMTWMMEIVINKTINMKMDDKNCCVSIVKAKYVINCPHGFLVLIQFRMGLRSNISRLGPPVLLKNYNPQSGPALIHTPNGR